MENCRDILNTKLAEAAKNFEGFVPFKKIREELKAKKEVDAFKKEMYEAKCYIPKDLEVTPDLMKEARAEKIAREKDPLRRHKLFLKDRTRKEVDSPEVKTFKKEMYNASRKKKLNAKLNQILVCG